MLYIEDLLTGLHRLTLLQRNINDTWRLNFVNTVYGHIQNGKSLSTNQGDIVLKIASNYVSSLATCIKISVSEVEEAIANPVFKQVPFVSSDIKREVRYIGMNKLTFRFKLDPTVVSDIKALRVTNSIVDMSSSFNIEFRLWVVNVDRSNLSKIQALIKKHKFSLDSSASAYIDRCINNKGVKSTFVLNSDENMIYANVCDNTLLAYAITAIMKGTTI